MRKKTINTDRARRKSKTERVPLAVRIPTDLAILIDCDPSYISHVNSGDWFFPLKTCVKILQLAERDPRLRGLTILHLRPEFENYLPEILSPFIIGWVQKQDRWAKRWKNPDAE